MSGIQLTAKAAPAAAAASSASAAGAVNLLKRPESLPAFGKYGTAAAQLGWRRCVL